MMSKLRSRLKKNSSALRAYRFVQKNLAIQRGADLFAHYFDNRIRRRITPFGFVLYGRGTPVNRRMLRGTYEVDDLAEYRQLMAANDVFVDIGANIGYYTSHALALGKSVISVEPQPSNLECLYRTLDENQWTARCEIFPVGLAAKAGVLQLFGRSGGSASLIKGWDRYSSRYYQYIPILTLDIVLGARFNGQRLFIKIDVEGSELDVLRGATNSLRIIPKPTFLVEIGLGEFYPSGINPDFADVFSIFWEAGYQAKVAHTGTEVTPAQIAEWIASRRTDHGQVDYVFTAH